MGNYNSQGTIQTSMAENMKLHIIHLDNSSICPDEEDYGTFCAY